MKKFEVPVKSTLFDFTHTKNIWLTIHPTLENLTPDKRDCTDSLLFSLDAPIELKEEVSQSVLSDYFRKHIGSDQNLLFYKKEDAQLHILQNGKYSFYHYHAGKSKLELIDAKSDSLQISPGSRFLITDCPIPPMVQHTLIPDLSHIFNFSFPLLFTLNEKIQKINPFCHLVSLLDFSPNESYGFKIKSNLNTVSLTIDMIKNKILKYDYKKIWKIETVLHEALVNAITYGNELNPDFMVHIHYEIGLTGFRIWIRDEGEGFDIKNISVPVGMDALDRISGRGIYIMKKFSDSLFFNETGNEIMIFFEFKESKNSSE